MSAGTALLALGAAADCTERGPDCTGCGAATVDWLGRGAADARESAALKSSTGELLLLTGSALASTTAPPSAGDRARLGEVSCGMPEPPNAAGFHRRRRFDRGGVLKSMDI